MTDDDRAQDDPADETPDVEPDGDRPAVPRPPANEIQLPRLPRMSPPPGNSGPY